MKKQKTALSVCLLLASVVDAQITIPMDSLLRDVRHKARFEQELDYTLSASNLLFCNGQHDKNADSFILLQNLKYNFSLSAGRVLRFSGSLQHNLGLLSYFDSITLVRPDDNTLNTRFDIRLTKTMSFTLNSILASRILNGYDYSADDSGRVIKVLNSAFCTPLQWTFSGGLSVKWQGLGSMNLGISTAKFTYIRDRSIFRKQNVNTYYGVPEGKDHIFEYGLSFQFLADKEFFKRIRWNCDMLLFKNYTAPIELTLKNNFGVRISKFLKLSIQSRVLYEEKVSRHVQMENLVTFGFYVHL